MMKRAVLSFTLLSLLGSAAPAQPHAGGRHAALHKNHARIFSKSQRPGMDTNRVTVVDDSIQGPMEAAEVVVYVDGNGVPFRTATEIIRLVPASKTAAAASAEPTVTEVDSTADPEPEPVVTVAGGVHTASQKPTQEQDGDGQDVDQQHARQHVQQDRPDDTVDRDKLPAIQEAAALEALPAVSPSTEVVEAPAAKTDDVTVTVVAQPTQTAGSGGSGPGTSGTSGTAITYSPYNADGTCRAASDILADFRILKEKQYQLVRIYGVDCNQVNTVLPAANSVGIKLMLGLFVLEVLEKHMHVLAESVRSNGGWANIEAVSVGNELVNSGQATVAQLLGAMGSARTSLRGLGFEGPVVVVDTFVAMLNNPVLCDESDFCAINVHAFFDPNTAAPEAGTFVTTQVARVRAKLANPNQRIVVTETGWPSQGIANGLAVPSKANQLVALQSILDSYGRTNPADLILFTAFNDYWKKKDAATFYAEQYWGIYS